MLQTCTNRCCRPARIDEDIHLYMTYACPAFWFLSTLGLHSPVHVCSKDNFWLVGYWAAPEPTSGYPLMTRAPHDVWAVSSSTFCWMCLESPSQRGWMSSCLWVSIFPATQYHTSQSSSMQSFWAKKDRMLVWNFVSDGSDVVDQVTDNLAHLYTHKLGYLYVITTFLMHNCCVCCLTTCMQSAEKHVGLPISWPLPRIQPVT